MQEEHSPHYFYGQPIIRSQQQRYIEQIVQKYQQEPVTDALRQKVWDKLQMEKHKGNIIIPFKMLLSEDPSGKFRTLIEIILDTKV